MKQYVIDELRPDDVRRVKAYLEEHYGRAPIDGVYWIPLADSRLTEIQRAHTRCRPFYFAAELGPGQLACELLVRTRRRIRCDCIRYATVEQRDWFIAQVDAIFQELEILT